MADFILTAEPPLGGYHRSFDGAELSELPDLACVAVSVPNGEDKAFAKALKAGYKVEMPDNGCSLLSKDGKARIMRFTADQVLVLIDHVKPDAAQVVYSTLSGVGYPVDQTHNWVALSLSGPLARAALERICAVNLHRDAFAIDKAERTVMEHLSAIIVRTGEDEFLLMSASSSAKSFLHAVETSINYVQI